MSREKTFCERYRDFRSSRYSFTAYRWEHRIEAGSRKSNWSSSYWESWRPKPILELRRSEFSRPRSDQPGRRRGKSW